MLKSRSKAVAVSVGEPAGVGPDLCLSSLADASALAQVWYYGCARTLQERAQLLGLEVSISASGVWRQGAMNIIDLPFPLPVNPGQADSGNAQALLAALRRALDDCTEGRCQALVTAPVSKQIIQEAGVPFTGHTEWLAEATGADQAVMMLATKQLRVVLATTHLPLREVPDAITAEQLRRTLVITHQTLVEQFGIPSPRLLVCGLNPHAGEGGLLGREEIEVIAPVIKALAAQGYQVQGPIPADTAFIPSRLATADAIIAMYHDQGLAALKAVGFAEAVNITLGLPIVRTSVDHGTAFDLAGSGKADHTSLLAAIDMAVSLEPSASYKEPSASYKEPSALSG